MPVIKGQDAMGPWYQWGHHGAKYRYTKKDRMSKRLAYELALRQGRAIHYYVER